MRARGAKRPSVGSGSCPRVGGRSSSMSVDSTSTVGMGEREQFHSAARHMSPRVVPTVATVATEGMCGWRPTTTWPPCWHSGTTPIVEQETVCTDREANATAEQPKTSW